MYTYSTYAYVQIYIASTIHLPYPPPPPTHTHTAIEPQTVALPWVCTAIARCTHYLCSYYMDKRKEKRGKGIPLTWENAQLAPVLIWCNMRTCSDRQTHLAHLSLSCPLGPSLTPECSHGVRHELTQLHLTDICVVESRG